MINRDDVVDEGRAVFAALRRFIANQRQQEADVLVRPGGKPMYCERRRARECADEHLDFVMLARAAYEADGQPIPADLQMRLERRGWARCRDFPPKNILPDLDRVHLRLQVWEQTQSGVVTIAFGGTVFTDLRHWRANLRWFSPSRHDAYTETIRRVAPAFSEYLRGMPRQAGCVIATGHSLGGGLAQQLAYAMPTGKGLPRIDRVLAFDPSPVTGYFSVNKARRTENAKGLKVDRIFERGEVLSVLRSMQSWLVRPSAVDPAITELRYMLFYQRSRAVILGHSIRDLDDALCRVLSS